MIVCSCRAVSDHALRDAVAAGASPDEVLRLTGAGSECGSCRGEVEALLGGPEQGCCGGPCESCPRRGAA